MRVRYSKNLMILMMGNRKPDDAILETSFQNPAYKVL